MRNILTVLTLCVLTLTTSSVFAERYDEARRTERFGLSFYEGRPLYIAFLYGYPSILTPTDYRLEAHRVVTGENIEDFGNYNSNTGGVTAPNDGQYMVWGYYARGDDGQLTLLTSGRYNGYPLEGSDDWVSEALRNFDPGVSPGDLAVETYDEIAPEAQAWARRGILLAVALLVISAGLNKFRELTSCGASTSETDAKTGPSPATVQESREERATMRKIHDAAMMGNLGGGLDERFLSETERREHDFITGKAFGLTFDDKVRASNKLFLESFNRLSQYEQEALLQEWRVSSYTESYQGSVERRFIDWREGSAYDGATSHKQTDAFDNWFSSDPFNGNDEDGEPPF